MKRLSHIATGTLVRWRDTLMFSDLGPLAAGKWPVRSSGGQGRVNPFFVLGHPRSGTTLLRALLCKHPRVFIPPENGGLWRMVRVFGDLRRRSWESVVGGVLEEFGRGYEIDLWDLDLPALRREALELPTEQRTLADLMSLIYRKYGAERAPGKDIWGDKTTPGSFAYLTKLTHVFPAAAYVHIVRDGRDCVASSIKAGFFDEDYRVAAQAWVDNVRTCRKLGRRRRTRDRFLEIRYEDLVEKTEDALQAVCHFLDLAPDRSMLEHHEGVEERLPDLGARAHHASVARPIFTASVGRWREGIPEDQQASILRILRPELTHYDYE